jgi:uncharacterized protein (UPF0332 family)
VRLRSEEFIEQARERLAAAREALVAGRRGVAVSVAYYSMLYAARATLSRDAESTCTDDTWDLFRSKYVLPGAFDAGLFTVAQHARVAREASDYQAVIPTAEEAERYVAATADFLSAVEQMIGD